MTDALEDTWNRARTQIGVDVGLYEGTKHCFATHLEAEEIVVQHVLGHADVRSTRLYKRLRDGAVVEALVANWLQPQNGPEKPK